MKRRGLSGRGLNPEQDEHLKKIGFGPKDRAIIDQRATIRRQAETIGMSDEQFLQLTIMSEKAKRQDNTIDIVQFLVSGVTFFEYHQRMPSLDDLISPNDSIF